MDSPPTPKEAAYSAPRNRSQGVAPPLRFPMALVHECPSEPGFPTPLKDGQLPRVQFIPLQANRLARKDISSCSSHQRPRSHHLQTQSSENTWDYVGTLGRVHWSTSSLLWLTRAPARAKGQAPGTPFLRCPPPAHSSSAGAWLWNHMACSTARSAQGGKATAVVTQVHQGRRVSSLK